MCFGWTDVADDVNHILKTGSKMAGDEARENGKRSKREKQREW